MKIRSLLGAIVLTTLFASSLLAQGCPGFTNNALPPPQVTAYMGSGSTVDFVMQNVPACGTTLYLFEDGLFSIRPNSLHNYYRTGGPFEPTYYAFAAKDPSPPQENSISTVVDQQGVSQHTSIFSVGGSTGSGNSWNNLPAIVNKSIIMGQSWSAAPGKQFIYLIAFKHPNPNGPAFDGTIDLKLSPQLSFSRVLGQDFQPIPHNGWANFNSYDPATQTVQLDFQGLKPGLHHTRHLYIEVNVTNPGALGSKVRSEAKIEFWPQTGGTITDETTVKTLLQKFPHDPNNILIDEDCVQSSTSAHQTLNYTINFQNVGQAPAQNVRIVAELGQLVNSNSVRITDSSFPVSSVSVANGQVTFDLLGIDLPGLNQGGTDQLYPSETTGFVKFKVCSESNLNMPNKIESFANIYFDGQDPITTNIAAVAVADYCPNYEDCDPSGPIGTLPPDDGTIGTQVTVYPSPFNEQFTLSYQVPAGLHYVDIQLYSLEGQPIDPPLYQGEQEEGYYELTYPAADLAPGMYMLSVQIGEYIETISLVKV